MVQARGIMLRENVKTIGHMIRLYTNKNTTLNGTGKDISYLISFLKELFGVSGGGPTQTNLDVVA